jgi:hypothetical protein
MSAYTHRGHVYFIACGPYVKIGYTSQPVEKRMQHLLSRSKLTCPDDLDRNDPLWLVHSIPGCVMRDERRIHGLFAAHRVAGEWFRFDVEFVKHLADLEYVTYAEGLLHFRRARADFKSSPSRWLAEAQECAA